MQITNVRLRETYATFTTYISFCPLGTITVDQEEVERRPKQRPSRDQEQGWPRLHLPTVVGRQQGRADGRKPVHLMGPEHSVELLKHGWMFETRMDPLMTSGDA